MSCNIVPFRLIRWLTASVAFLGLTATSVQAQFRLFPSLRPDCRDADMTTAPRPTDAPPSVAPEREITPGALTSAALGDSLTSFGPGYLDNAVPFSHFRLRFDSAYRDTRPDRAEYFYGKCGCFRPADPNAPGPPLPESSVDYQDISAYMEWAPRDRFSVFLEVPYRFLNPEKNNNVSGLADMNAGFKFALVRTDCRVVTFQGRIYFPSGDPDRGLGNDHVSLEPSILIAQNLSERLQLFGQFGDWIPVGGTEFAGNILRYGAGVSYTAVDNGRISISPVVELLGWSVLSGKEVIDLQGTVANASGDTIINAKVGVRIGFGGARNQGMLGNSDLYVGYGRALTGETWYRDIVRVEYRLRF